jgi:hypothetical protein
MLPIAICGFVTKGVCQGMFRLARLVHWVAPRMWTLGIGIS